MCILAKARDLVFDAEAQLLRVHAVVRLVAEVCHTAMNNGEKAITLQTNHDALFSSDATSVFTEVLESAVQGLEQIYLLLDEAFSLLREDHQQAPDGNGHGEPRVQDTSTSTRKEDRHADA